MTERPNRDAPPDGPKLTRARILGIVARERDGEPMPGRSDNKGARNDG